MLGFKTSYFKMQVLMLSCVLKMLITEKMGISDAKQTKTRTIAAENTLLIKKYLKYEKKPKKIGNKNLS